MFKFLHHTGETRADEGKSKEEDLWAKLPNNPTVEEYIRAYASRCFLNTFTPGKELQADAVVNSCDADFNNFDNSYTVKIQFSDGSSCYKIVSAIRTQSGTRITYSLPAEVKKGLIYQAVLKHNFLYEQLHQDTSFFNVNKKIVAEHILPGTGYHICKCGQCGKEYVKRTALAPCPYCNPKK